MNTNQMRLHREIFYTKTSMQREKDAKVIRDSYRIKVKSEKIKICEKKKRTP